MRHRAQDRGAIHHLGKVRQQLAHVAARQARGNRAQLAANFDRRIGLGIDPFDLAGRAVEVDQDDRLGAAERLGTRRRRRRRWPPASRARSARLMPARPRPPMRSKSRRVMPSHSFRADPRIRNMAHLPPIDWRGMLAQQRSSAGTPEASSRADMLADLGGFHHRAGDIFRGKLNGAATHVRNPRRHHDRCSA